MSGLMNWQVWQPGMATEQLTKNGRLRIRRRLVIFYPQPNSLCCASRYRGSKYFLIALLLIAAALVLTNAHLSAIWLNVCRRTILCLHLPKVTGSRDWRRNIGCERYDQTK